MSLEPQELDELKLKIGIPVMAHIGFTPQSVYQIGGYRIQGKTSEDEAQLLELAEKVQEAGAFAVVLELCSYKVAKAITDSLQIPTIGIGAGPDCDGQVLVTQDLLGMTVGGVPNFVKTYATIFKDMKQAITQFKKDVQSHKFPESFSE